MEATNSGALNINGNTYNNAGGNITASSGGTVNLYGGVNIQGGTLNNSGGAFLGTAQNNSGVLDGSTAAGAVTINGTYSSPLNTNTYILGTINNNGTTFVQGGNGTNSQLLVDSTNLTLQGGGIVTLSTIPGGGSAYLDQAIGSTTLTNVNNTIQGDGILGNNGLTIINQAGGTINANSTGQGEILQLNIQGARGLTNAGLIEATNNGILNINGVTVNNAGGRINAVGSGATVQLYGGTTIQGGTLNNNGGAFFGTPQNNSAILDGSTVAGAVTINGTYTSQLNTNTYIAGTINNKNNFLLQGGNGTNTQLLVDSTNLSLQGGGTVTLSTFTGGGNAYLDQAIGGTTLTNVNNTIQGDGILGNNGLTIINQAIINANSNGFSEITSLTLQSTAVTNTGLMEATNSGVLNINGVVVNNAGGNITASGPGAAVQLYGSTQIQGGTLNNNGGAFFGTPQNNTAYLDGSTGSGAITINGTYTGQLNTDTLLLGTINNKNSLLLQGGNGTNSFVQADSGSVMLQGGGTVTLQTLTGGGNAYIQQAAGGLTLTNVNNAIQGDGILGNNGLTIINQATINANSNGGSEINSLTLQSTAVTNTGLIEATNSGVLNFNGVVVNNAGGNITANGGSASVQLYGSTSIQGGTLNNNGGAFFGTPINNAAFLDGSTASGMVTLNGTYTSDLNTTTLLLGTINNHGNILVNGGSGNNTNLFVDSSTVTLQALIALTGGSSATFSSTLTNPGVVDLENASSLTVNGATNNSGILSTSRFGGTGGNTMSFTALLTNTTGAHVDVLGPNDTVHMSGGLANAGFVVVQNGSTVDPPFVNNIGVINIDSTSTFVVGTGAHSGTGFVQLANGTLGEMISNSNLGQVFVNGSASLDGTLDILLQGGFNPLAPPTTSSCLAQAD